MSNEQGTSGAGRSGKGKEPCSKRRKIADADLQVVLGTIRGEYLSDLDDGSSFAASDTEVSDVDEPSSDAASDADDTIPVQACIPVPACVASSGEEEEEEEEQEIREQVTTKSGQTFIWSNKVWPNHQRNMVYKFKGKSGINVDIHDFDDPVELFEKMVDAAMLAKIVEETNRLAHQLLAVPSMIYDNK